MRIAIPDLGFPKYAVSAGTTICVSETATERMAEEICFPLNHRQSRMLCAHYYNDTRIVRQSPKEGQKV